MNEKRTTDDISLSIEPPTPQEPAIRFIDVHIYDYEPEPEAAASVESHVEHEPEAGFTDQSEQENTEPVRLARERWSPVFAGLGIVCIIVIGTLITLSLLPLWTPDVTVTIIPSTQSIRMTTNLPVTTGPVTGTLLPGRTLAAITMNQAQTVPTTGKGHQDARAAHGSIAFYNAATSPQTVIAGTLLTGADGVQIITDQDATLAAVRYPTLGQTTVPAHAILTGPAGNIQAGDIYGPCCRLNVSAVSSAFSGGLLARDYPAVTQQDITTVVSSLKTSLNQSAQAALQTQVHPDETLITPVPCQETVKPDHQSGEEATQVTIMVSETCTGMTYQTQALHRLLTHLITQEAHSRLGEGYMMQGDIQASINQATPQRNRQIVLQVTCAGRWGYQFTQWQQAQIKAAIMGKSKAEAITILLHTPGVQTVSIESERLPTDVSHIHVVFLIMQ